ncbi:MULTISPECIES: mannitol dehydrogenase family protein [Rhizobium/Agrobacterium group]|jgi:tagaturonate reductase|uniref:Mannitol dehydrogenase family protein n=2 Tax=Agrobacterium tumefaciens complex TaxID=1183400 RepID=A0AAE6EKX5_AGRTU|nr:MULTISPECIES: mannitol dehydrogenase family protein [Rhizobium/Agrobacterium group]KRA57049.1 D-mannonate oxidoreductase [Rhizobium sp. Root651]MCA2370114.1 mannitol dehydrogenase family protein [Agrobacterium tomkonis CIP 111-78]QCL90063.1 mannitol dehydrogenase family protein [Agrobacterium tumefaciens]QCM00980.1 mannitol dehydrogenase family protein [Agrobacterium tumefaciens]TKT59555.1 mannitol dehydrogenase family protein [Agrobacterium sp. LC34]
MTADTPILQFGTSRFLLAHADLFVSQALDKGEALGHIAIVQTTGNAESLKRVAALNSGAPYPVRIRGISDGKEVDEEIPGKAVARALTAATDWAEVRRLACMAEVILSNTGDRGYELDSADGPGLVADFSVVPKSFPAKLCMLLLERFQSNPEAPLSIFPCELVPRNGERLQHVIRQLADEWQLPAGFAFYLNEKCRFANSLVDRIVSEPIDPVGAVAEPYALWAIERQEGLVLPCAHPAIVLTDDLDHYEKLKLFLLNLGHSYLAERWMQDARANDETVRQAMGDDALVTDLETLWRDEVLPVFAAEGMGDEAEVYISVLRERLRNPFLAHRLADIAGNHDEKKRRRFIPIIAAAERLGLNLPQHGLRAALATIKQ